MIAIANYVWVDPDIQEDTKTGSGIIVDLKKPVPNTGKVIAIGKYCDKDILGDLIPGDKVVFDKNHIRRVKHPVTGKEIFIFPDRNIWAIL